MTPPKHAIRPGTLEAIVEGAITALGLNPAASMSEIAVQAGVGRATLHRHFPTRDDLVMVLQQRCMEEMNEAAAALISDEQSSLEQLTNAMRATIPLGDRYNFLSQTTSDDETLVSAYREQLDWIRGLVADLKTDGHIAGGVPDSWALALIDQLIWIGWDQVSRGRVTAEEAPELAVRTLLNGLGG